MEAPASKITRRNLITRELFLNARHKGGTKKRRLAPPQKKTNIITSNASSPPMANITKANNAKTDIKNSFKSVPVTKRNIFLIRRSP